MAKDFARPFYNSKKWKQCKTAYKVERILIDGGLCESCKEKLGYIVHHTVRLTPENINNPEITLNHKLLKYDCKDCHDSEEVHQFIKKAKCKCFFDKNGQPFPRER